MRMTSQLVGSQYGHNTLVLLLMVMDLLHLDLVQLVNALTENPHNYFVFMSFNFGILPAIIFFYFILSIIVDAIFTLKANQVRLNTVKYAVVFSLVVYLSTMLIQSMYGGTLDTIRSYIFLFSSSLAIIVHLKSSLKLDNHIILEDELTT